jgi:hypothetical protein
VINSRDKVGLFRPNDPRKMNPRYQANLEKASRDKSTSDIFHNIYNYLAAGGQPITWGENASKALSGSTVPSVGPLERIVLRALDDRGFRDRLNSDVDKSIREANEHGIRLDKDETSRLKAFVDLYDLTGMVNSKELVRSVRSMAKALKDAKAPKRAKALKGG